MSEVPLYCRVMRYMHPTNLHGPLKSTIFDLRFLGEMTPKPSESVGFPPGIRNRKWTGFLQESDIENGLSGFECWWVAFCSLGEQLVVRVKEDYGELQPWHCIHVYSIESRLSMSARWRPTQGPSWGYSKVNFQKTLSIFGDKCPQSGSKNDTMAPRTTL